MAAGFETDAALSLSVKGLLAPSFPKDRHNRSPGMNLNSDFSARAAVHAARLDRTPSPIPGVDRRMLHRIGESGARDLHRALCPTPPVRCAYAWWWRRGVLEVSPR